MTKQFVCDVCGEPYDLDTPHIEITIQEGMDTSIPEGTWDICSMECMETLLGFEREDDNAPAIEDFKQALSAVGISGARIVDDAHEQQIVIDRQDREYAKEVEDAGTGVYFPEGMRVDGRDASQIRPRVPKIRMVRDDG
jgi:hypothetical protein